MNFRKWIRWFLRFIALAALAVLCLLLTSRWWVPAVLPAALGHFAVEVDAVERVPGGDLRFTGLAIKTDAAYVRIDAVQLPSELAYLRERFSGSWSDASSVEIGEVEVRLLENERKKTSGSEPLYLPEIYALVREGLQMVDIWMPPVRVGTVKVLRGTDSVVTIREASFIDRKLRMAASAPALSGEVEVAALLESGAPWSIVIAHPESTVTAQFSLDGGDASVRVDGTLRHSESEVELVAVFGDAQWLPQRASVASDRFLIDPQWLPITGDVRWEALRFDDIDLVWKENAYSGALRAQADAVTEAERALPLTADLALSGDLETLRIEACELVADWGQLSLNEPVTIRLKDRSVEDTAIFRAEVDLAKQPFVEASGRVKASLKLAPSLAAGPDVRFELGAEDLGYQSYRVDRVELSGRLQGDALSVDRMKISPLGVAGDQVIEVSGEADLSTRELKFGYAVMLSADWVNTQVGQTILKETLNTRGRIEGSFERPIVDGTLDPLTFELPEMVPVTLAGTYRSEGMDWLSIDGTASARGAALKASFDAKLAEETVTVDLKRLIWTDPERQRLELEAPTRVSYRFSGAGDVPEARMEVAPFHLSGDDLDIRGRWNSANGLDLSLRNVRLERVGRWMKRDLPELLIESVELSFSELRPHILGSIGVHMESRAPGVSVPLRLDLSAQLTKAAAVVDVLQLKFANEPLLQGVMAVPMTFRIPSEGASFWNVLETGALSGELNGSVTFAFSDWLEENTGVKVKEATVDLEVKGSLRRPAGRIDLKVASLETPVADFPPINRIELVAEAASDRIRVDHFDFLVNQSEVSGALSVPIDGLIEAIQGDLGDRKAWLSKGAGQIELVDWQAKNWVEYLPAMIRRSGRLNGALELKPGWDLSGSLSFDEFALRPTESMPSVDMIGGRIELSDRRLTVREASAKVGGSPVSVAGWLDAGDLESPLWEFTVAGTKVPLVRTTDMILRSDLDIKASHTSRSEAPLIRGVLNLRSSTMLVEFDPLAPNVESGPRSQPPFFSIKEPAVANWRFDLKIHGDSFMRVRSPYFKTELTANFDLGGTLGEPLLLGSVRLVEGELRFPGAKMRIASGEAFIEPGRPNSLQLDINGIAQKTSYIITMEVSQTLEDPLIQFQSTPALSNAALVRLLTTGSTSGGGVGTVGLYLGQGLLGAGGMDEGLADRLTVDVGEETSRSGRNTVGVRYDLSEDFFLEGGYDVYDAYNMDLIWSIFKR